MPPLAANLASKSVDSMLASGALMVGGSGRSGNNSVVSRSFTWSWVFSSRDCCSRIRVTPTQEQPEGRGRQGHGGYAE